MVPAVILTVKYCNTDGVSVTLLPCRSWRDARCEWGGRVATHLHMSPADYKLNLPAEVLM